MTKMDINIRIYFGTDDKWHNIAAMSSIWHMTFFELYYNSDSTIWAVQKSPNARFADCQPVRPFHSSNLRCLNFCCDSLNPQGQDGETVYRPEVLESFSQLYSIHRRPQINRFECGNRFSVICNTFIRISYTNFTGILAFSPCSHCLLHQSD